MSGVEIKTTQAGAEGAIGQDGKRTYTAYLQVRMSNAGDGPSQVLAYLHSLGYMFQAPYRYGTDMDVRAFCNGITPKRRPQSIEWWDVTVTYGPLDSEDPQDINREPSDNPDDWRWQHNMGYSTWQEAVWKATNKTTFPHPTSMNAGRALYFRPFNTPGMVCNSAGIPYDPPLMRDLFDRVWQITTFSRVYDGYYSDKYMGSINSQIMQYHPLIVNYYGIRQDTFTRHEVKCTNATATYRTLVREGFYIPYWEWHWEFRFRPGVYDGTTLLSGTWLESVLDMGLTGSPRDGMPTGKYAEGVDPADDIDRGVSGHIPIRDTEGGRIPERVLFDGAGWPLQRSDSLNRDGVYFDWLKDQEYSFAWEAPPDADSRFPNIPFPFFTEVT